MQDDTHDERLPAPRRGIRPADLHVYSEGERLSPEDDIADQSLFKSLDAIDEEQLARALGWFSVALGLAEVVAPRQVGRALGVEPNPNLMRAVGLREIASGVGILTGRQRAGWLWSRVAGDAMDLALLGAAIGTGGGNRSRVAAATAAVAGVTALDVYVSRRMEQKAQAAPDQETERPARVTDAVTVNAPVEACYRAWRDLASLPRLLPDLESVTALGDDTWRWVLQAGAGRTITWDARLTTDDPPHRLAWSTLPGAAVPHAGSVDFTVAPGGRGTIVRVELQWLPPAGRAGALAAALAGRAPGQTIHAALARFRQWLEAGEIATTEGQAAGSRSVVGRLAQQWSPR